MSDTNFNPAALKADFARIIRFIEEFDLTAFERRITALEKAVSDALTTVEQIRPLIPPLQKEFASAVAGAGVATSSPIAGAEVGSYTAPPADPAQQ